MNTQEIAKVIVESIETKTQILQSEELLGRIAEVVEVIVDAYRNDKKVLFCGNGGSAGDAQHLAAELSGRFYYDRKPLFAEALHVNSSYITAVANDYSFDVVYSRLVEAFGREGDVLVGLSTSGNSKNVLLACEVARQQKMKIVAFTGASGGEMAAKADYLLNVPSSVTPRIQESHIMIGHIICEMVEKAIFPRK